MKSLRYSYLNIENFSSPSYKSIGSKSHCKPGSSLYQDTKNKKTPSSGKSWEGVDDCYRWAIKNVPNTKYFFQYNSGWRNMCFAYKKNVQNCNGGAGSWNTWEINQTPVATTPVATTPVATTVSTTPVATTVSTTPVATTDSTTPVATTVSTTPSGTTSSGTTPSETTPVVTVAQTSTNTDDSPNTTPSVSQSEKKILGMEKMTFILVVGCISLIFLILIILISRSKEE